MNIPIWLSLLAPWIMIIGVWLGIPYQVSRESGIPYRVCLESLFRYASGDRLATVKLAKNAIDLEENK